MKLFGSRNYWVLAKTRVKLFSNFTLRHLTTHTYIVNSVFLSISVVHNLVRGTRIPILLTCTAFDPSLVKRVILTPAITIRKLLPRRSKIAVKCRLIKWRCCIAFCGLCLSCWSASFPWQLSAVEAMVTAVSRSVMRRCLIKACKRQGLDGVLAGQGDFPEGWNVVWVGMGIRGAPGSYFGTQHSIGRDFRSSALE